MAKEWILNLAMNRWGLNKKRNVGPVSLWIREASPRSVEVWEQAYYQRLEDMLRERSIEMDPQTYLNALGEWLWIKVTEVVRAEIDEITLEDCQTYIRNLVIVRTFNGYRREIETVYGQVAEAINSLGVSVKPAPDELDRRYNVDFVIDIGKWRIGLQIKPISYRQMPEAHRWHAWMHKTHRAFTERFGGKVFIIFSVREGNRKQIANPDVIDELRREIMRLQDQCANTD